MIPISSSPCDDRGLKPKVSVCVASYNHAPYISDALDSILQQEFRDFEIIVVDDGSTDDSHAILLDYQQRYPGLLCYLWHDNHVNKGISATCNVALAHARGEYVAWLGSDDWWHPDKLTEQVLFLESNPDIGMVHTAHIIVDSLGRHYPPTKRDPAPSWEDLLVSNHVCASSAVMRKQCLDKVGHFDENLVYSDWDMWIRIGARQRIGYIPTPLTYYRIHGANISVRSRPEFRLQNSLAVIQSTFENSASRYTHLRDQALAAAYMPAAMDFFAIQDSAQGLKCLNQAAELLHMPLRKLAREELITIAVTYTVLSLRTAGCSFLDRLQFLRTVFTCIDPRVLRRAEAEMHITEMFLCRHEGDRDKIRQHFMAGVAASPTWLRNRGVLSVGIEAFVGGRIAAFLRRRI